MLRMRFIGFLAVMVTFLNACGSAPSNNGGVFQPSIINWERDPSFVVFSIDVIGGESSFLDRNRIPLCAVYGDNRVVWTDTSQPNQTTVLFDVVQDNAIYDFVTDLTVNKRIYTYESGADVQPLSEQNPVVEQVKLHVNGKLHITDGFSGWASGFFTDVLSACRSISQAPALFEPAGGWISAVIVEADNSASVVRWDAELSGLPMWSFSDSDRRVWVDDPRLVKILWNVTVNTPFNRQFEEDDNFYHVAFEVPGVQREAPPAPAANELEAARRIEGLTNNN